MRLILLLFFTVSSCFSGLNAQEKQVKIIDELERNVPNEGFIIITADPKIKDLIGVISPETSSNKDISIVANGFRIQVFMSNNPRTARRELLEKIGSIKSVFTEIAVHDIYAAPNWKLLVGDFLTKEEAEVFKQKLQKSIPGLGREMYIVQDKINIQIQKNN